MHARVTTVQVSPDTADEGIRQVQNEVIPAARQQKGFNGGFWLADRQTGKVLAITLWETEADMQASEEMAARTRSQVTGVITEPIVERYEVVAKA